jgi:hypothetical protein
LPVFTPAADDVSPFHFFTSPLVAHGTARQAQIVRAFGALAITAKRAVKKHRTQRAKDFFTLRGRGPVGRWRRTAAHFALTVREGVVASDNNPDLL